MAMRPSRGLAVAGLSAAALALLAPAGPAAAQPDIVPLLNNPMNASVGVQNLGVSAAGPSQLTINCTRFGKADGGCPDAPGMAAYVDPAFQNRVVIDVPALAPGESFSHDLAFWNAIAWPAGTYIFDAEADAGSAVGETAEANNATQSSLTQQPGIAVAPRAPLPLAARPAPALEPRPKLTSGNIFQLKQQRSVPAPTRQPAAAKPVPLRPAD
ncbi:MAG: hypothetical protein Kow00114_18110 [Kiloniellaceae bacterium]